MSQVGRPFWKVDTEERIEQVFYDYLAIIRERDAAAEFVNVFLTPTEAVNLPKRLGIAILLTKSEDWRNIKDTLHVSTPTIARVAEKIRDKSHEKLNKFIADILRENLPERSYDPTPFRGKRLYRRKGEGVKKPYRNLPY